MTPTVEEIIARAMQESKAWPAVYNAGSATTLALASIAALEAAGFVIVPKAETQVLLDWIELWDKVCDAADPDDSQEPPAWPEVVKQVLPDWNMDHVVSAEYWSEYQRTMLTYAVRDFQRAMLESRPQSPSGGEER